MAKKIKGNYPKYKFIITADTLYCIAPMMNICKNYKWKYIFNLNDRLKTIFKDFLDYIEYFNDTTIKNYKYKGHIFHMIKFNVEKNNKTLSFHYVTNLEINDINIKKNVVLGRNRWKIENQEFYNQKKRMSDITHLNSRNNRYFFIQFAHAIRQFLEQGCFLIKSLKLKIKEVSEQLLNTLTSTPSDLNNIETNFQLRFDT